MKREEKNAQSRQRILSAAMEEFAARGYQGASLNTICAENDISKGLFYHYFKDKDELYLLCVRTCFDALTDRLRRETGRHSRGAVAERLAAYFDARMAFFVEYPLYLELFADATLNPPPALAAELAVIRKPFDALNLDTLAALLESADLRKGLTVRAVVEEFRMYVDFFNGRFRAALHEGRPREQVMKEHEEKCRRQLDILLHGVLRNDQGGSE